MKREQNEIYTDLNEETVNHLEPSQLKITGSHGRPVKLYRFIGSPSGEEWENVKEYFFYVTPEFVLRSGVTGFRDYGDIGWYCKHKDLFIVEQRLGVPLYLTVGYRERLARSEAGEWFGRMKAQRDERSEHIREIKGWFTEAYYPDSVRDYLEDIISSCRVYVVSRRGFFEEGGICFLIREDQDFVGMFVNLEFNRGLGNCRGVLDGIFCYVDFEVDLADLINDWCVDVTEEFRELFVREREFSVYHSEPHHCKGRRCLCKHHKFHSGCTLNCDKPWRSKRKHY